MQKNHSRRGASARTSAPLAPTNSSPATTSPTIAPPPRPNVSISHAYTAGSTVNAPCEPNRKYRSSWNWPGLMRDSASPA